MGAAARWLWFSRFRFGGGRIEQTGGCQFPRWLRILGDASYAIYLVHYPFLMFITPGVYVLSLKTSAPLVVPILTMIVSAVIVGCAVHFYIEKPLLGSLGKVAAGNSSVKYEILAKDPFWSSMKKMITILSRKVPAAAALATIALILGLGTVIRGSLPAAWRIFRIPALDTTFSDTITVTNSIDCLLSGRIPTSFAVSILGNECITTRPSGSI